MSKFGEMMTRVVKGPSKKKIQLSKNILAARQSYIDVENFVINFIEKNMPEIITLSLETSNNKDGDQLFFVTWTEKISGRIFRFSSEPFFAFSEAMELYSDKESIMDN